MKLPFSIRLHSSRLAFIALTGIHGLAGAAIIASHMTWMLKAAVLAFLVVSVVQSMRNHVWRSSPNAIVALTLRKDGDLELIHADGHGTNARLDFSSTVLHWLIALRLREQDKTVFVFLLPDMLEAESWRHLSILLRAVKPSVSRSV